MAQVGSATVVIVGGGVTGLSAGWWLARSGVDVIVLEKGIVGGEAAGRNGGNAAHPHSPLGAEEMRLWPDMDEMLGYPTEWEGNRVNVFINEEQFANARRIAAINAELGYRTEFLDVKQLKELVPIVGDNALGGSFSHFGGHAHAHRTTQAYAWAFQDHGGRLFQHTMVTGMKMTGDRITEVETTQGTFGCDFVVDAAGPQTALIAAMAGVEVPLAHARVEIIVTAPLPLMYRGGISGNGLYGRQTKRGNLHYGGGPHEWIEMNELTSPEKPNSPLIRNIGRRLAELFPGAAHVPLLRGWAGVVERTPDGLPIIERMDNPNNLVIATMSASGFGLSPATGKAISELVMHGKCLFADLGKLKLSRFADTPADWRTQKGWVAAPKRPSRSEVSKHLVGRQS